MSRPLDCRHGDARGLSSSVDTALSNADAKTWAVELLQEVAGDFTVCFSEDGATWTPLPQEGGGRFLRVLPLATDPRRARGFFQDQRVSASTLTSSTVALRGSRFSVAHLDSQLGLGDCAAVSTTYSAVRVEEEAVAFAVSGLSAGEHDLCVCDSAQAERRGDGSAYQHWSSCTETAAFDTQQLDATWAAHLCTAKCPACRGDDCYCDEQAQQGALCLPHDLCRDACDAHEGCAGFLAREGSTSCRLVAGFACGDTPATDTAAPTPAPTSVGETPAPTPAATSAEPTSTSAPTVPAPATPVPTPAAWQQRLYRKRAGSACDPGASGARTGFVPVGRLYVSSRAHAGVTLVLPPGVPASVEVSGERLSDAAGVSLDRVMVVDEHAVCGVDGPAHTVVEPRSWGTFAPWTSFDAQVFDEPEEVQFSPLAGYFCPANNVDIAAHAAAREHSCYTKCSVRCVHDECFCDGYKEGSDLPTSNALCVSVALCRQIASTLYAHVVSFDMHNSLPRCFLNARGSGCNGGVSAADLVESSSYTLFVATAPPAAAEAGIGSAGSSPKLLRFEPVHLRATGVFKVCFCDASVRACEDTSAYGLDLGPLVVSGVSCLLESRATTCAPQRGGGLRCYDALPPVAGARGPGAGARDAIGDFCAFGPEEEVSLDPRCAPVGPEPTPAPTPAPTLSFFGQGG